MRTMTLVLMRINVWYKIYAYYDPCTLRINVWYKIYTYDPCTYIVGYYSLFGVE